MQLVDMEDRVVEWTRVVTTVLPSAQTLSRPEDGKGSSINESCCLFVFADRLNAVPLLCRLNCRRFGAPLLLDKLHQYAEQFAWRQGRFPVSFEGPKTRRAIMIYFLNRSMKILIEYALRLGSPINLRVKP